MSGLKTCEVCRNEKNKYKCPGCLVKYCSVGCFKSHKEAGCAKNDTTDENLKKQTSIPPTKRAAVEPEEGELSASDREVTEDSVPKELLQKLNADPQLLTQLGNPHLRNVLLNVDSSKSAESVIHNAMLEPIFTEFANTCLSIIEPDRCDNELQILKDRGSL